MRKKILLIFIAFLSGLSLCWPAVFGADNSSEDTLTVTLFISPRCKRCMELKDEFLPQIKEKYKDDKRLEWRELDVSDEENLQMLLSIHAKLGEEKAYVPSILVNHFFLSGKNSIVDNLEDIIVVSLDKEKSRLDFEKVDIIKMFKNFSALSVIGAGLLDGINPCAFAVIVFFISFLAVYGYRKREIILVGSFYCLAVFITYLLIGLGVFKVLYAISNINILIKTFYYFVAVFCFVLFVLALYDYFRFRRDKTSGGQILQLPNFLKKRIHLVIGAHLREKSEARTKQRNAADLIISSFVVGVLVSLLEAACTGQVYVPVIVSILKYPHLRAQAIAYLFLYNLMFIFPLLVIFLLSLLGFSSDKFNEFLKTHLGKIKLLMAALFLALGLFVLGYEHVYKVIEKIFPGFGG